MTIEAAGLVESMKGADKAGQIGKDMRKRRCKKKRRIQLEMPAQAVSLTLQRLFLSCQRVFKAPGSVPSPIDVQALSSVLDAMRTEDVGLSNDLQFFKPKSAVQANQRVAYATIHECESFSLCMFILPESSVIPLHNHPEMTVFSKLLSGTMRIRAYDWVDSMSSNHLKPPFGMRLAKLETNGVFTAPCDSSVLYPTSGGNIHEFTAITPCVFLDVIGPPYSKDDGRDCSYYKDTPCDRLSDIKEFTKNIDDMSCYAWLEEVEIPKESEMDRIEYMGPRIIQGPFPVSNR